MVRWPRAMPARTADIIAVLDELLEPERFEDYGPNGLQVAGRSEVDDGRHRRLGAAWSCSSARSPSGAQLVLVHHGLFWGFEPAPASTPRAGARLQAAVRRTTSRSPPTTCRSTPTPRSATTRCSPRALGADRHASRSPSTGRADRRRRRASTATASPAAELFARVRDADRTASRSSSTPARARVRTLGIVSGARRRHLADAIAPGLDAFLTGEPARARDGAGAREPASTSSPPATTRPRPSASGALGELLAERFGVAPRVRRHPEPGLSANV